MAFKVFFITLQLIFVSQLALMAQTHSPSRLERALSEIAPPKPEPPVVEPVVKEPEEEKFNPVEHLSGDKSHKSYRRDHGGRNYHDHLAFRTKPEYNRAILKLRSKGIRIGSTFRAGDWGYHGLGLAFDIPGSNVPWGQEVAQSQQIRKILRLD